MKRGFSFGSLIIVACLGVFGCQAPPIQQPPQMTILGGPPIVATAIPTAAPSPSPSDATGSAIVRPAMTPAPMPSPVISLSSIAREDVPMIATGYLARQFEMISADALLANDLLTSDIPAIRTDLPATYVVRFKNNGNPGGNSKAGVFPWITIPLVRDPLVVSIAFTQEALERFAGLPYTAADILDAVGRGVEDYGRMTGQGASVVNVPSMASLHVTLTAEDTMVGYGIFASTFSYDPMVGYHYYAASDSISLSIDHPSRYVPVKYAQLPWQIQSAIGLRYYRTIIRRELVRIAAFPFGSYVFENTESVLNNAAYMIGLHVATVDVSQSASGSQFDLGTLDGKRYLGTLPLAAPNVDQAAKVMRALRALVKG